MKVINIDIETYSSNSLPECGVYKYAEAPDFSVLLFAYSVDGGPVNVVDLASGERLPDDIRSALTDESVVKKAFNATFERVCLSRFLGLDKPMSPLGWRCTMVAAARAGLPLSLGDCGEVLRLTEGKMKEGRALIKLFSCPGRSGQKTGPSDRPEEWEVFKAYCKRDVEVEMEIGRRVERFEQPEWEQRLYELDQRINDRGVLIDPELVTNADKMNEAHVEGLVEKARELTGLENPKSTAQLKEWLERVAHVKADTLNKKSIGDIKEAVGKSSTAYRVLQLREQFSKTSCQKYGAMLDCVCRDGRIHGLLQYYGAARTGRWAGRLVQLQNLPQNHLEDIDGARRMVKAGDLEEFELNFGNVSQNLSELIRTALVAPAGQVFHVCDFSAIEARVIAWLAGEEWVLEVFRNGGDIYCATASQMFGVEVGKHGPNADLRPKGKIAALALGYGGGGHALEAFGAQKMGMTPKDIADTVKLWRRANKKIVNLWAIIEEAAIRTIETGKPTVINRGVTFEKVAGCLQVKLPSGRRLCYPRIKYDDFEKDYGDGPVTKKGILYEGMNQVTKKWGNVETYGGKMTENLVQAIARDILAEILFRAEAEGLDVAFHVHDEIIVEAKEGQTLEQVAELFSRPIEWAPGLPLKGAGYTTPYYLKD